MKILNVRITKLTSGSALMVTLLCALLLSGISMVQSAESAEVWVLTDTRVNPNDARTEFIGGVGDPTYFGEPRFLGTYELFTVTDGSITHRDKSVDHDYLYYDATFIAKFDRPPARMTPGDTITLNATTEGSGYVSEHAGGWNAGITFQYRANGQAIPGDSLASTNLDFISDTATVNFTVPAVTAGGQIDISPGLWNCSACLVEYIYEPGTAEEEVFVLTNISPCGVNAALGQERLVTENTGDCGDVKVNGVQVPQNSSTDIKESDLLSMGEKTRTTIDHKCVRSLLSVILQHTGTIGNWENNWEKNLSVAVAILLLEDDPSLCRKVNSKPYAEGSGDHISLGLQSGGVRFEQALADLALDIETDTAKVSSVAINDFAVGHNPDTGLTIAACYQGSVTVDPTNPALASVTLKTGKQVEVTKDSIGPITQIPQSVSAPILLLLDDGAK